jgi:hypothetical protein
LFVTFKDAAQIQRRTSFGGDVTDFMKMRSSRKDPTRERLALLLERVTDSKMMMVMGQQRECITDQALLKTRRQRRSHTNATTKSPIT